MAGDEGLVGLVIRETLPLIKDGLLTYIAAHHKTRVAGLGAISLGGDFPAGEEGCPYCACVKLLAAAHRYLVRGATKPQWGQVYQQLASYAVQEAVTVLQEAEPEAIGQHLSLMKKTTEIDILISKPLSAVEMRDAARRVWDTSEVALDMAEWLNNKETTPPPGDVIDGEVRVVS